MDYYDRAGLTPYLDKLGFNLVGYGCTTCIGNSGPLPEAISAAINEARPDGGQRALRQPQLRGPDQPRRQDELPGLAAAGGRVRAGRHDGPGHHHRSRWAPARTASRSTSTTSGPAPRRSTTSSPRRSARPASARPTPTSSPATSSGSRCPPRRARPSSGRTTRPTSASLRTSRAWRRRRPRSPTSPARGCWPSSATRSPPTTSRRPARSSRTPPPASTWPSTASPRHEFNSYGSRRGNHEVMIRGTFANIRLRNQLVPGVEGGFTVNHLTGEQTHDLRRVAWPTRRRASRWSSWPARSTARARPATGRRRAPCCSASARSSPRATSASTAPT